MNIDQAKNEAKSLVKALRALGLAELSATQALDVIAKMNGYRNWQTAQAAGGIGAWNAVQRTVYEAYPHSDLLPLAPGDAWADCGDTLFTALMDVAASEPLSRVIKTTEHWADEADRLQKQVVYLLERGAAFDVTQLALPKGLAASFRHFLDVELREDTTSWLDVGARLETTRRDLYCVALALRNVQDGMTERVMLLDNADGVAGVIPVRVPEGMTPTQARQAAGEVIESLRDRQTMAPDALFDYSVAELKVRLAQAGLVPMADTYLGPAWD